MITIDLGEIEEYDNENNEFIYHQGGIVRFEYSLKAMYEWEARWKKPFLKRDITDEELKDFFRLMALDPFDYQYLTNEVMIQLSKYIDDPQTATVFASKETSGKSSKSGKIYTAEEIYANMVISGIPIEFEERNLNRLLTILRIISIYNEPPKKMSRQDILKQNASLNEQRKAALKTKG